ncbi:hypothetical protein I3760_08G143100 [Carya illinoinensis]|nr:hypothetical protein I3760_08G143100 [Carya illinoinensis]
MIDVCPVNLSIWPKVGIRCDGVRRRDGDKMTTAGRGEGNAPTRILPLSLVCPISFSQVFFFSLSKLIVCHVAYYGDMPRGILGTCHVRQSSAAVLCKLHSSTTLNS